MSRGGSESTISPGINPDDLVQVVLLSILFIAFTLFCLYKLKNSLSSLMGGNVPKANAPSSTNAPGVRRKAD
jgi:hypothetical protein